MLQIRSEQPQDSEAIRQVEEQAFGQPAEADLVDRLRAECPEQISFVAIQNDQLIGHALITPAIIEYEDGSQLDGFGLAPVAVLPAFQNLGVGTALIHAAIKALQGRNERFLIVLGEPGYYPRFGFEPASRYHVSCEFAADHPDAFMIHLLGNKGFKSETGAARYHSAFYSL